jgi:hypothetical protein
LPGPLFDFAKGQGEKNKIAKKTKKLLLFYFRD